MNEYLKEYIDKIEAGEELTEEEIEDFVCWCDNEETLDTDGRWTNSMFSYSLTEDGKFGYGVYWEAGATECQDSEYTNQPFKFRVADEEVKILKKKFFGINEEKPFFEKEI